MSTTSTAQTDTAEQGSESTSTKTVRLVSYLRDEAADGEAYIKAKFIADGVDLSPKEIDSSERQYRHIGTGSHSEHKQ